MSAKALLRNMSWLTLVSGVERAASLFQTVLLARALGITDYGVYGLIFGTIGMVASLAAMQLGMTATVFVARYRELEKDKAAFVLMFVRRFGFGVSLIFLCTLPFATSISAWLVGPATPVAAVVAGCIMVALSIVSGIQDGILQGFEDFRSVAIARLIMTALTLAFIYPAGLEFGLLGATLVVLCGIVLKYAYLARRVAWHVRNDGLSRRGSGLGAAELIWNFGLPAMLVSLLVGVIGWSGTLVLSRQSGGFDALAVVNTGVQWRGPILLLAGIVSTVAIPAISRHWQRKEHAAIHLLHRLLLVYTGGVSLLVAAVLSLGSPLLLSLYGPGFVDGALVFSLLVLSTVPQVIVGLYCQHYLANGRVWRMLFLHSWLVVPLGVGYVMLIPRYHSLGYAVTNLAAYCVFAIALALTHKSVTTPSPSEALHPASLV
ncbi:MAG: oligosaccharide flippase family protein [Myxococcaceae bacterium]